MGLLFAVSYLKVHHRSGVGTCLRQKGLQIPQPEYAKAHQTQRCDRDSYSPPAVNTEVTEGPECPRPKGLDSWLIVGACACDERLHRVLLVVGSTVYVGRGEPNSSTCAPGSLTLCDFFQNHAGSFVLGHNWAALTSIARTHFEVNGNMADVYFECHHVDVATGVKMSSASIGLLGQPSTGPARRVKGKWLLSFAEAGAPTLSSGY